MRKCLSVALVLFVTLFGFTSCDMVVWDDVETVSNSNSDLVISIEIPATNADRVEVSSVLVNSMGMAIDTVEEEYRNYSGGELDFSVNYYGKHEVVIKLYSDNKLLDTICRDYIVTSDDYNIALLSATVPVTYTSLMLADADSAGGANVINASYPTIIGLERADAYDWANLLPKMTDCPFLDGYHSGDVGSSWSKIVEGFKSYVRYLHKLDSSSKFHFIFNDMDAALIPLLAMDAGLGLEDFSVVLISDGSGTYGNFISTFGNGSGTDSSIARYEEIASTWNTVKTKALIGDSSYKDDLINYCGSKVWLKRYMIDFPAVLVNDPDLEITWIMNRNNSDVFGTSQVYTEKVQTNPNVLAVGMNTLLPSLTEDEKTMFSSLYDLSLDGFEEADRQGKKIMIFLGTRDDEDAYLDEFLSFFSNYYDTDEYMMFYKGHPGDLTGTSSRADILDRHGFVELDAQIPAELFAFFREDAFMGGYPSSTYSNIETNIAFITVDGLRRGLGSEHAYIDDGEGYVEIDGNRFHVVRGHEECYWDPSNPSVFDFTEVQNQ